MIVSVAPQSQEEQTKQAPLVLTPLFDQPLSVAKGYPERFPVPNAKRAWEHPMPEYAPPLYESPRLIEQDRTKVPGGWADPAEVSREEFYVWSKSGYTHSYEGPIKHDPETGRPLNPLGRTGIAGRGALGKWGPNHAADALLTRVSEETGLLEILLIKRRSGEWAIPGGMVDGGETPLEAAYRELVEESGVSLDATTPRLVYQGMGDGPRNTDNAWIETSAYHFHLSAESDTAKSAPIAGDDATGAEWKMITPALIASLYANHGELVLMALTQSRVAGVAYPEKVDAQLKSLPHVPLLSSISSLQGRIGIFGGSFDPVHDAHVKVAELVAAEHNLDAVVFVPTGHNPLKAHETAALPRERVEMLYYALRDKPGMFVCPVETRSPGNSFTVDTLERFRSALPKESSQLFLIVGADCFQSFNQWKDYRRIPELAEILPIARPGTSDLGDGELLPPDLSQELGGKTANTITRNLVPGLPEPLSSTQVREQLRAGQERDVQIPPSVLGYLHSRGLYGG